MKQKTTKVLLVDDDIYISKIIETIAEEQHFSLFVAHNIKEGRQLLEMHVFNAIILDVTMPYGNGIIFCKELRNKGVVIPIIIISGNTSVEDVVEGLEAGADDYLRKPISLDELKIKLSKLLKNTKVPNINIENGKIQFAKVLVNLPERTIILDDKKLEISNIEFAILLFLIVHKDVVISREYLSRQVWGDKSINVRSVDAHIYRLRCKIEEQIGKQYIETKSGHGYSFVSNGISQ